MSQSQEIAHARKMLVDESPEMVAFATKALTVPNLPRSERIALEAEIAKALADAEYVAGRRRAASEAASC